MSDTCTIPEKCDLLIKASWLITQDADRRVIKDAVIGISGTKVIFTGRETNPDCPEADEIMNLDGKLVMPGLVNSHCHSPMTLLRGLADDYPLMVWLTEHIWPVESNLTEGLIRFGARLAAMEMIRTGTTALMDSYFQMDKVGEEFSAAGMRCVAGEGFFKFPSPMFKTGDEAWACFRDLNDKFKDNELIRTAITPHAIYTTDTESLQKSHELAMELGILWQTHAAESAWETSQVFEMHGTRPIRYLKDIDVLGPETTLHHLVDVTEDEMDILAENKVKGSHNPSSNMKLSSGVCPAARLIEKGLDLGLGTDGTASNNNLNMFKEMRRAALLQKVHTMDPCALPAQTALDMATISGAQALGWEELGRIEPGSVADIIALDLDAPNLNPMANPVSHAVYSATGMEVCMTMVAGRVLYRDGEFKTLDTEKIKTECAKAAEWVLSREK